MRASSRIWKSERIRRLSARVAELREALELETARRQELQRNELALFEARDEARTRAATLEMERDKALDRVGELLETRDRVMAERDSARDEAASMGQGILVIHGERLTHTTEHQYDADHDDVQSYHQLAAAAAVYAAPVEIFDHEDLENGGHSFEALWPWRDYTPTLTRPVAELLDVPGSLPLHRNGRRDARIHELAKAGSLIAAEIERIIRLGGSEKTAPGRADLPGGGPARVSEAIGLCGIGGPGGHDCFRVKGHEGPHSWEGSVDLGPGPGRDHGGSLYADDEAGGAPR